MRRFPCLLLSLLGLLTASACEDRNVPGAQSIRFQATVPATRTVFTAPEGDVYPVRWTADDQAVCLSLNGEAPISAPVHADEDGGSAWFEATFSESGAQDYTFRALSPASACRGIRDGEWDFDIPTEQTPSAQSVDPAAMVLEARSETFASLPGEVALSFRHLSAYGCFSLTGLNTEIESVTLDLGEDCVLTLHTSRTRDIWFAAKPRDLSGRSVQLTVHTRAGKYRRTVTFPEDRALVPGRIARFTVDMSEATWESESRSISILAIGNSFSVDVMEYLYGYLAQAGYEDIFLGNLYIGGCTLATHADNITGNRNAYQYYTNASGSWSTFAGGNVASALQSRKWDYVSIQQASGSSGMPGTFDPYLSTVVQAVREYCPDARLMWHMTWAYQGNATHSEFPNYGCVQIRMYRAIVEAVQSKVLARGDFDFVIPCGTAIQNLRTSFIGDTVTRDGYHMSYNIGRAATALMWLKQITGCPLDGIDVKPAGQSLTQRQADAIKDAVEKAYAHPYEVTPSADPPQQLFHIPDPSLQEVLAEAGYDPARFRELPYSIVQYAYYNSTGGSGLTSKAGGSTASNIDQFSTTQFFSQEDIPVGSVLVLKSGYQYRPEGWTRLSARTTNRPGNVTTQVVPVTESWWNGWAYRAFNLAEAGNPALTPARMDALLSCLSIFVPVSD